MRPHFRSLLVVLLTACFSALAAAADGPPSAGQWIAVTAPAFREALEPLRARRAGEGFDAKIIPLGDLLTAEQVRRRDGEALRGRIGELAAKAAGGKTYLLLVGVPVGDDAQVLVPALAGSVNRMKSLPTD